MKKFITEFGRGLIDLFAVIVLIGIVIMSLGAFVGSPNPLNGIVFLVVGMVIFILTFYLLYLLIDIKDNTSSINDLLKEYLEKNTDTVYANEGRVSTKENNITKKAKDSQEKADDIVVRKALEKLIELRDKGMISLEEFNIKQDELLKVSHK